VEEVGAYKMSETKDPSQAAAERAFELGSMITPEEGEAYAVFVFREGKTGFMTNLSIEELARRMRDFVTQSKRKKIHSDMIVQPSSEPGKVQ